MKKTSIAVAVLGLGVVCFIIDRILKYLALNGTTFGPVNGGVRFELFQNPAIAFSISFPKALSLAVIPVVCILFVYFAVRLYRARDLTRAALLIVAVMGAASNYLDRVQHGYVVDYVSLGNWFPVFNLGDMMIIVPLVLLLLPTWHRGKTETA